MRKLSVTFLVLLVLSVVVVGAVSAAGTRYQAHLSGPSGIDTLGQGQALFTFSEDGSTLTYKLIVANTVNVTQAHIHVAATPGGNGPVVLWLYPSTPPPQLIPGRTNGVLMEGTVSATNLVGPMAGMTLADLEAKIQDGLAYVNVHTTAYPGGEIRGTIR